MQEWDGVEIEMEITEEEFASYGNLARVIDGQIFLGPTEDEKAADEAKKEIERIKAEIASRDYRVLKSEKLKEELDDLYPGESAWYKASLAAMAEHEKTVQVIEPEFRA
jgi:hypothetical protein